MSSKCTNFLMKALLLFICFFHASILAQNISINEIMSKNNETIVDIDNESSDWIEIYNASNEPVNLHHFGLSDEQENLFKWEFPDTSILANSVILIFASGKNYISNSELHTNFKIAAEGEELYLTNAEGVLIDVLPAKTLLEDQSYGCLPNGSNNIIVLDQSSPDYSNNTTNQLEFTKPAGFYQEEIQLGIKSFLGDSIYFSLDGSIPTQNSFLYIDSFLIYNKSSDPNYFCEFPTSPEQALISYKAWESPNNRIDKATILRCRSYKNGIPSSRIYTHTYFVDENMNSKYEFPIISLVTDQDNLFNVDSGIYVPGIHFDENNPEWTGNYFKTGKDWERAIHIEYFEQNGSLGFAQDAGVRIHGGKTRTAAQKSLKFYARKEYGTKEFNYKLLPNKENEKYNRFLLRTSMGSWSDESIIKDVLTQEITKDLNFETQDYQPIILFINGEYWGIQTLRDRIDEHYIEYEHHLNSDSIDLIGGNYNLVFSGSSQHYLNLLNYIENTDLSIQEHYDYVLTQIDIDNYLEYQIAEMFFANYDWPENNMKLWRPQTDDGKWRWIFYDLDAGLRDYEYNMFNHCTQNDPNITWPNSPSSTFLFRNLLKNSVFKMKFSERYSSLLNSTFSPSLTLLKSYNLKNLYKSEIEEHVSRWHYPSSENSWEKDIEDQIVYFLENRPCSVQEHIKQFINPTNFDFDCTTYSLTNRLKIAPNPNDGHFILINNTEETIRGNIIISSINGRFTYLKDFVYFEAHEIKNFDLSHLPNGVYLLNYKSSIHSESLKFVIVK